MLQYGKKSGFATCIREVAEPLEAENASLTEENTKLRALAQELVDACYGATDLEMQTTAQEQAIAAAKEQGFVPTNTRDK